MNAAGILAEMMLRSVWVVECFMGYGSFLCGRKAELWGNVVSCGRQYYREVPTGPRYLIVHVCVGVIKNGLSSSFCLENGNRLEVDDLFPDLFFPHCMKRKWIRMTQKKNRCVVRCFAVVVFFCLFFFLKSFKHNKYPKAPLHAAATLGGKKTLLILRRR